MVILLDGQLRREERGEEMSAPASTESRGHSELFGEFTRRKRSEFRYRTKRKSWSLPPEDAPGDPDEFEALDALGLLAQAATLAEVTHGNSIYTFYSVHF